MLDPLSSFTSPAKSSTITSISTTLPSCSHAQLHARAQQQQQQLQQQQPPPPLAATPPATPNLPSTPSTKSPFFTRLEQEHDASSASIRTDSPLSYAARQSFQASTLSSASMLTPASTVQRAARQPRRPLSTPPAVPRASRAASHSVSRAAWRQWSKHSANNSDCDSILSEPASYSSSAHVSNDIWIVQNDVAHAKPLYTPRARDRARGREFHSANLRRPMLKTRVVPAAYDAYDDEGNSSKLLSQFLSGSISPTLAPNNKRAMSEFDRQHARESMTRANNRAYYTSARYQQQQQYASYKHANNMHSFYRNEPCVEKKRFSPRRIRWWLRKWTQKMRGQWEYNF